MTAIELPSRPARTPGLMAAASQVALRALRKFLRTPGLSVMGVVQSAMFLFSFRYVFGGAIHAGATSYVDFLGPAYVASIVLFTGGGVAVAGATDKAEGFTDRLLSMPVSRYAPVFGRVIADSATIVWAIISTAAFGFLFGFRLPGSWPDGVARARPLCGLCGRIHRGLPCAGPVRAERAGRPGDVAHRVRLRVHLQRLRAGYLDTGLAPAVREVSADHADG
jgi:hypothetical protein